MLILFTSCNQYDDNLLNSNVDSNKNTFEYNRIINNDSDLFESIFFTSGSFAKEISLFQHQVSAFESLNEEQKAGMKEDINLIVEAIKKKKPDFFKNFNEKIKSNDHYLIDIAIEQGSREILDNIKIIVPDFDQIYEKVESDITNGRTEFNTDEEVKNYIKEFEESEYSDLLTDNMITNRKAACSLFLGCAIAVALYFVIVVHNSAAVAANIYLIFALWGWKIDSPSKNSNIQSLLMKEILIDEIANKNW